MSITYELVFWELCPVLKHDQDQYEWILTTDTKCYINFDEIYEIDLYNFYL